MYPKKCKYCGSSDYQKRGTQNTGANKRYRIWCKDCGRYTYNSIKLRDSRKGLHFHPPKIDRSKRHLIDYGLFDVMFTENELDRLANVRDEKFFHRLFE